MKKRKQCMVDGMAVLLSLMLTACNPLKADYLLYSTPPEVPQSNVSSTEETAALLPNNEATDRGEPVDLHGVVQQYLMKQVMGLETVTAAEIAQTIGLPILRETEAGALYSVHEIKQGGRLYIFYSNFSEEHGFSPHEDIGRVIRWFYVQKELSSQDFAAIQEGSTVDELKKIDPVTQLYENIYHADPGFWDGAGGSGSFHYLRDGIMDFGYENVNGELVIRGKRFTEGFQLHQNTSISFPYDGTILPEDWVS